MSKNKNIDPDINIKAIEKAYVRLGGNLEDLYKTDALKAGDLCPNCKDNKLTNFIRYKKDTGLLVCPRCWYKYTADSERVKKVLSQKQKGWAHPR